MKIQTWSMIDTTNTYWEGKGKYQAEYDEMQKTVDAGSFEYTQTSIKAFRTYYRFYNDGDVAATYRRRVVDYSIVLENRVNDRIQAEWKRYNKMKEA